MLFSLVVVLLCVDEHPAVSMLVMPFCCLELTHRSLSVGDGVASEPLPT